MTVQSHCDLQGHEHDGCWSPRSPALLGAGPHCCCLPLRARRDSPGSETRKKNPAKHSETMQPWCPSLACCGTLDDTGNCGWFGLVLQRACYSSASSPSDLVGSQVTGSKLPGKCPRLRDRTRSILLPPALGCGRG